MKSLSPSCIICGSSGNVIRNGARRRAGDVYVQKYKCKACDKQFTLDDEHYYKVRWSWIGVITDLYKQGKSSRQIAKIMYEQHGLKLSHTTVMRYVKRTGVEPPKPSVQITVSEETAKRLRAVLQHKESFDSLISRMLDIRAKYLTIRRSINQH